MRSLVFVIAVVFLSGPVAMAEPATATFTSVDLIAHEGNVDENGCHVARRKRHSEHCH